MKNIREVEVECEEYIPKFRVKKGKGETSLPLNYNLKNKQIK